MMSALGGKDSVPAAPTAKKAPTTEAAGEPAAATKEPKRRSWLGRLFGGNEDR